MNFRYNVNMNMNYRYPTRVYESIMAQMYAFLVLFTIFAFCYEKIKLQNYFSTRNMYIWAKVLSYIAVG